MLDDTIFLFSVTLPGGEELEVYRQDERGKQIDAFLYIIVNRFATGHPLIFIYHDYEKMREFIFLELAKETVMENALEEAK